MYLKYIVGVLKGLFVQNEIVDKIQPHSFFSEFSENTVDKFYKSFLSTSFAQII